MNKPWYVFAYECTHCGKLIINITMFPAKVIKTVQYCKKFVYLEECENLEKVLIKEELIKKLPRAKKDLLIKNYLEGKQGEARLNQAAG